jgi:hypothetical protein
VNEGDVNKFNLRKPVFTEYEKKRTVSLLWQLSLILNGRERKDILTTTKDFLRIDDIILKIRNQAPEEVPDRPKAQTEAEENRLTDEEDKLKKDFGQFELFRLIEKLSQMPRWQNND